MGKRKGDEAARRRARKRAEQSKQRAKRRPRRRPKGPAQGELFYTGEASQRRFASGKKVGRPREEGSGIRHGTRPARDPRVPLHVTTRVCRGLPTLRGKAFRVIRRCIREARERFGLRVLHFSVQKTHMHLLVEVDGGELEPEGLPVLEIPKREELAKLALAKGMKGLLVRIARALNGKLWKRRGRVFADRYHVVELGCPQKVWRALRYVLNNGFKHRVCLTAIDPCSSGRYFDGWEKPIPPPEEPRKEWPVVAAKTWLAREGWKRHGLIPFPKTLPRVAA